MSEDTSSCNTVLNCAAEAFENANVRWDIIFLCVVLVITPPIFAQYTPFVSKRQLVICWAGKAM